MALFCMMKKILTEKSIPFRNVRSAKDIIVVGHGPNPAMESAPAKQVPVAAPTRKYSGAYSRR